MEIIKYHHMCLYVKDMDATYRLYRDLLGFSEMIPPTVVPTENDFPISGKTLDDIFHTKGTKVHSAMLKSSEGAFLELLQPLSTPPRRLSPEEGRFPYTGVKELALSVTDIDGWFERVRAEGYETQTDYIWETPWFRSFMFFDPDHNQVQLVENKPGSPFV